MNTSIVNRKEFITDAQISSLAQAGIIPANTPKAQVEIFAQVCAEKKVSPFSQEIYLVNYGGKYSTITSINGYRKIACETGQYAGKDDAKYDLDSNGKYKTASDLLKEGKLPQSCTVTVYRVVAGLKCGFTHTAVFKEFAGAGKWKVMPFQMISKVAEAFALRAGFSDRLTGLSIPEEAEAFEGTQTVNGEYTEEGKENLIAEVKQNLSKINFMEVLLEYYKSNPAFSSEEIAQLFTERKAQIKDGSSN